MKAEMKLIGVLAVLAGLIGTRPAIGQTLDKVRLGNSGTGINVYLLDIGKRLGIFRKNGIDLEVDLRQQRLAAQPSAAGRHLRHGHCRRARKR